MTRDDLLTFVRGHRWAAVSTVSYPDYCRTRQLMKGLIHFRVRPKWMRYSDFRKNPASVITVNLVTGEETRVFMPFRVDSQ